MMVPRKPCIKTPLASPFRFGATGQIALQRGCNVVRVGKVEVLGHVDLFEDGEQALFFCWVVEFVDRRKG